MKLKHQKLENSLNLIFFSFFGPKKNLLHYLLNFDLKEDEAGVKGQSTSQPIKLDFFFPFFCHHQLNLKWEMHKLKISLEEKVTEILTSPH